MTINCYKKGQRSQQKAKRYYESMGYEVEVTRYDKWRTSKDFFSLWDLICVGPHDIRFVQVKTNRKPDKDWMERAEKWGTKNSLVIREYVVYRDYQRGDAPSATLTFAPNS